MSDNKVTRELKTRATQERPLLGAHSDFTGFKLTTYFVLRHD